MRHRSRLPEAPAASYVLRNPLHHGVVPIPYAYPHCTASTIFSKDMGHSHTINLMPRKSYYRYLGRHAEYPETYKMNDSGIFLRESVLDIPQVENLFGTPRAFNFFMNRKSSDDWEKEQLKDNNNYPPVNLLSIEKGITLHSPEKMLILENGRVDYKRKSVAVLHFRMLELMKIPLLCNQDLSYKPIAPF